VVLPVDLNLPTSPDGETLAAFRRPVWVYNLDTHRVVAASPSALVLWRASSWQELADRSLGPVSQAVAARLANYREVIRRSEVVDETWTLYPRGIPVTLRCVCSGVVTPAGELAVLVEAEPPSRDELESARAVEAFRHDPAPMVLFSHPDGVLLLANPAAHGLLGGQISLDTLFADADVAQHIRGLGPGRESVSGEDTIRSSIGDRVVAWRAAHGVDPVSGGEMVAVTLLDVTAVREAAHTHFRAISQAIAVTQDGIALTDPLGNYTYMNASHLAMFGYTDLSEVRGKSWQIIYDADEVARFVRDVFPLLGGPGASWRGPAVGRRADGVEVTQEVTLTIGSDGGIICMTRDITARLAAEAQRHRLELDLAQAQKMETVGQFVGGLAHDINNALGAILGTAGALLEESRAEPDPLVAQACQRIERASSHAGRLVRRMLDFVRREEGAPVVVDLRGVLERGTELLRVLLPRRVDLTVEVGDKPLRARVQEDRVLQVLLNLASNSRDAMRGGPGQVRVMVRAAEPSDEPRASRGRWPDGPAVEIQFEDDGPGIPSDVLPRLFEPFFTTKPVGQGTGLGLSTSAGIVEEISGRIEAWNTPTGAAFRIILPRFSEAASFHVLFALSDRALAMAASQRLQAASCAVGIVSGGRAALDVLLDAAIVWNVVVVDGLDSEIPGLAVASTLKATGSATVPVLLTPTVTPAMLALGCPTLPTPAGADELVALLTALQAAHAGPPPEGSRDT
jgi:PAS domain S-box-containing protein